MSLLDSLQNTVHKVFPEKKPSMQSSSSGGIGNGHVPFDDDMIVSKPTIIFHTSQVFFNFLAFCCFCSCAAFQQKWKVGPSGLSAFSIFLSLAGIFFSLFMLLTPVIYEKYDKGARLARALKEVRVAFILVGTGVTVSLLISFITTISAWTQPGCKNPDNDPHKDLGDDFKRGLDGFCNTKKAGAIFFWFLFIFWVASLVLTIMDWRNGKTGGGVRTIDPPFTHPTGASDDLVSQEDEESLYHPPGSRKSTYDGDSHDDHDSPFSDQNRYSGVPSVNPPYPSAPGARPSIDAYGAFSDPPPTGFGSRVTSPPPQLPAFSRPLSPLEDDNPRVSRTMQYADPYAAVRATVEGGKTSPSYGNGYR